MLPMHGVTASARTVANLTIDLAGVTNAQLSDFSVNDITVDFICCEHCGCC